MKLKVSTNSRSNNKENPQFLHKGWINKWLTPTELGQWVQAGKAWAGTWFSDGKRSEANADGSNAIVFDFDGELQLDHFWTSPTAQSCCALTYTSASSTEAVNRFRAVFPLDGVPLTSAAEHKAVYKYLAQKLSTELGFTIQDDCGEKPERLWYGNDAAQIQVNENAALSGSVIATIEVVEEPRYEYKGSGDITNLDIDRCIWLLEHFIEPSGDGEYNERYVPITAACAAIGNAMVDAWIDWVSRGHHGEKRENMNPERKWRGLGDRSGPASIYAIAKRQDLDWKKYLPQHLWFGGQNAQRTFEVWLTGAMTCAPKYLFRKTT